MSEAVTNPKINTFYAPEISFTSLLTENNLLFLRLIDCNIQTHKYTLFITTKTTTSKMQ